MNNLKHIKISLYEIFKELATKTHGIVEIKKVDLLSLLSIKCKLLDFNNIITELESDNKIIEIQKGHVAKNYIWEVSEIKDQYIDLNEIITLQHATIKELKQDRTMYKQKVNLLEIKNNHLYKEIQRIKSIQ